MRHLNGLKVLIILGVLVIAINVAVIGLAIWRMLH